MHTRKSILDHWEKLLLQSGIDSPRLSAQVLLASVLGISRLDMLLEGGVPVDESCRLRMNELGSRRMEGEPVAYIVGEKEFYGFAFQVGPEVLIPRPETELILDRLVESHNRNACLSVVDIGTGSGALAVSCAKLFPNFRLVAVDISPGALMVARKNAKLHGVEDRILFLQGDLLESLRSDSFDIVLANLPYVPLATREALSREVLFHEPQIALFAGPDGLDCYRALARSLRGGMKDGALLLCEIDHSQGAAMVELFKRIAKDVRIMKDYAGLDRVVVVVF
ncbi:MAG: peptide chain release factor N(5)-glutamine methyltransferase [Deltaproteobacteria bacterium HGW-Deltaproteobacteria-18]|nr:MAG: peptide chain release factor N(5)-glutamine methyltransferase [Deltaproteobacteria bacterium HGW-Deltaproteobacteria-18]